jgi:hypothetical protein
MQANTKHTCVVTHERSFCGPNRLPKQICVHSGALHVTCMGWSITCCCSIMPFVGCAESAAAAAPAGSHRDRSPRSRCLAICSTKATIIRRQTWVNSLCSHEKQPRDRLLPLCGQGCAYASTACCRTLEGVVAQLEITCYAPWRAVLSMCRCISWRLLGSPQLISFHRGPYLWKV